MPEVIIYSATKLRKPMFSNIEVIKKMFSTSVTIRPEICSDKHINGR